jgi:hypothetical protein
MSSSRQKLKIDVHRGRYVLLQREHRTKGGLVFAPGEILRVCGTRRSMSIKGGSFSLEDPKNDQRFINGVDPRDVKMIGEGFKP